MSLPDLNIAAAYETYKNDPVAEFYIPVLGEAVSYKRIAGFFSSSSLAIAARGIGKLIENDGIIQMIACPKMTAQDAEVITNADEGLGGSLEDCLFKGIDYFEDEFERDHVRALGWLLASGRLELKIAIVESDEGASFDQLFHQKVGIIEDMEGNKISFSGSINETAAGWLENVEEFKVFKSWRESDREWINPDVVKFEEFWNNERNYVEVVDLPEAVKRRLIEEGQSFQKESLAAERYIQEQHDKKNDSLSLFSYQKQAIEEWEKNNRRLLFEMATGTGKTRTAIAASKTVLDEGKPVLVVVATPQSTLSMQWADSYSELGISFEKEIVADSTNSRWKKELELQCLDFQIGLAENAIIYTTHLTASSPAFIEQIERLGSDIRILFIGDETHGLGSLKQKAALLDRYDFRIGLSATPARWFDDEGSALIREYYNEKSFVFSIWDALNTINPLTQLSFLTPYIYKPIFVKLDSAEMDEYKEISKKVSRLYAAKQAGPASDDEDAYLRLLFRRSNILKNAAMKISEFSSIVRSFNGDLADALVFVSPQQIDEISKVLKGNSVLSHRFTMDEGTKPCTDYGGLSERRYIIERFKERQYQALVAMTCLDEGIDIPSARIAFLLSNSTNPREYIQRIGRVIRRSPGKEEAVIYDFVAIPDFQWIDEESDYGLEEGLLRKELQRVEDMSSNAENRGNVQTQITHIWEEFYRGAK